MESLPEKIGRYEVLSTIGRGAMGVVYRARDPLIGREVALKTVNLSGLLTQEQLAEFKARFFREAQAAGVLHHPNIVTIHDVGEQRGMPFMAMELVEGTSLSSILKERTRLPATEAVAVVKQVAQGLAFAHGKGVIHRDIKPDNILVERATGRVVIADFGVAHISASELTRTGEVLGTPFFMSPEQVLSAPLDGRSDLFSLGVVFYLSLTGTRPFKGDTISSVCYHIVHEEPEPPPPDAAIPTNLAPVIFRLLAKEPGQRFADGAALVSALESAASAEAVASAGASPASSAADCTLDLAASPVAGIPLRTGAAAVRTAATGRTEKASVPPEQKAGRGKKTPAALWVILGLMMLLLVCFLGMGIARRAAMRRPIQQPTAAQEQPSQPDPPDRQRKKGPPGKNRKNTTVAPEGRLPPLPR